MPETGRREATARCSRFGGPGESTIGPWGMTWPAAGGYGRRLAPEAGRTPDSNRRPGRVPPDRPTAPLRPRQRNRLPPTRSGRIEWVEGDFVAVAATVPSADLVALDRVVCCYPAYAPLLEQAAAHSRRLLAMSYPRDRCGSSEE